MYTAVGSELTHDFTKYRNSLQHAKINRETYVSYNLQKLDKLRDHDPNWLEYYSTELVENVPEVQATVVGDVWIDIHFWWEIFTNIVVTNIVITNIAVTTKYSRYY